MQDPPSSRHASAYQRIFEDRDGQLQDWLRQVDRAGALPEARAAFDNAFALGHAAGLEEGRAEHLDSLKTLVLKLLEAKFGAPDESVLDHIDAADPPRLERWILAIVDATSVRQVLDR